MQREKLLHGGDYNPEQWLDRPDILAQDVAMMKQAHVNVVTLGVFSWSLLEPREGEYHLDWLADIIHNLYSPFWPLPVRRGLPGWHKNAPKFAECAATARGNCSAVGRITAIPHPSTGKRCVPSMNNWPAVLVKTRR